MVGVEGVRIRLSSIIYPSVYHVVTVTVTVQPLSVTNISLSARPSADGAALLPSIVTLQSLAESPAASFITSDARQLPTSVSDQLHQLPLKIVINT